MSTLSATNSFSGGTTVLSGGTLSFGSATLSTTACLGAAGTDIYMQNGAMLYYGGGNLTIYASHPINLTGGVGSSVSLYVANANADILLRQRFSRHRHVHQDGPRRDYVRQFRDLAGHHGPDRCRPGLLMEVDERLSATPSLTVLNGWPVGAVLR